MGHYTNQLGLDPIYGVTLDLRAHKLPGVGISSPVVTPRNVPAARNYTDQHNGLLQQWEGRIFFNPFGPGKLGWDG